MKYRDLVKFEYMEEVIELTAASSKDKARHYVNTYVMSEAMCQKLNDIVLEQLQFDRVGNNKGLFIVGNYGTGKSHLMSMLSLIAENGELIDELKNEQFKEYASSIAGKFKVVRFETGATNMSLRDIVMENIQRDLEKLGIDYIIPSMDKVSGSKATLIDIVGKIEEKFDGKGYMLVIDEMFDYLGSRKEQQLMLDLNFLREIGEVCKTTKLRFMVGVQETLFQNPKFQHVHNVLMKVKDRYDQLLIQREDIAFVVSERMLKKDDEQKAWIREHLEKFSSLYEGLTNKMTEFVDLFPIHPMYFQTLEKATTLGDKREVFKVIGDMIKKRIDEEVDEEEPCVISYDEHFKYIKDNVAMKHNAEVKEIIEKSAILMDIIERNVKNPIRKQIATRIINALSISRLTSGDLYSPVGITLETMKEDLCLFVQGMPELDELFLKMQLEAIMKEINSVVSGQFISQNKENKQYYLDLKKDVDYEARIREKAEMLDEEVLDKYYYEVVKNYLTWEGESYVSGFEIYAHSILWQEKNIKIPGYVFFGIPEDRSTAQPERDFYIYYLPVCKPYTGDIASKKDEVYIAYTPDEGFKEDLGMFAASILLGRESTLDSKKEYRKQQDQYLKRLIEKFNQTIDREMKFCYRGKEYSMVMATQGKNVAGKSIKSKIDIATASLLATYFDDQYPRFPRFKLEVGDDNKRQIVQAGLNYISGIGTNDTGRKILDTFGLLEGTNVNIKNSLYADYFLNKVKSVELGKVINYSDLMTGDIEHEYCDREFKLDPVFIGLIFGAMVSTGDIIFGAGDGKTYDATMLKELAKLNMQDIMEFKFIARPKDIPLEEVRALFELFDINSNQIHSEVGKQQALTELQAKAKERLDKLAKMLSIFNHYNVKVFNTTAFSENEFEVIKVAIRNYKEFLDKVRTYDSIARLKSFNISKDTIENQKETIDKVELIESLKTFIDAYKDDAGYIDQTINYIIEQDYMNQVEQFKEQMIAFMKAKKSGQQVDEQSIKATIQQIKECYTRMYLEEHKKARLGSHDKVAKDQLLTSQTIKILEQLGRIQKIIPTNKFERLKNELASMRVCYEVTADKLESTPYCTACGFNPHTETVQLKGIGYFEKAFSDLLREYTQIVLNTLEDPTVQEEINKLENSIQQVLKQFVNTKNIPNDEINKFIEGINLVLSGVDSVEINLDEIIDKIEGPVTIDAFNNIIKAFMQAKVAGKDKNKVRLVIKK